MAQTSLNSTGVASSGSLVLQSNGTTAAVTIDTSQNVGVGVTPSAWATFTNVFQNQGGAIASSSANNIRVFQNSYYNGTNYIYKTTEAASRYDQQQGSHVWFTASSGTAGNAITFTQAMTLDVSGNLGVGTTSPSGRLDVTGGSVYISTNNNYLYGKQTSGSNRALLGIDASDYTFNGAYSGFIWNIQGGEKMRLDSSGNLLIQTTNASDSAGVGGKYIVNATAPYFATVGSASSNANSAYTLYSTGAGAYRFYVGYGGTVYATSTTITGISDQRLKENIRDLEDGLEKVMALQPRKFDWKEGKGAGTKDARGFIAQEFETVFPDMIEEWRDPAPEGEEPYKAVNANLIPTLVKAIQEQQAIITQLQADVAALKA